MHASARKEKHGRSERSLQLMKFVKERINVVRLYPLVFLNNESVKDNLTLFLRSVFGCHLFLIPEEPTGRIEAGRSKLTA